MSADPTDITLPVLRIAVESRAPHQEIMPVGHVGIIAGDSCEVVAEPHTIRIESFVVTDTMRDADKARFAATEQLFEENRALRAENAKLADDVRRLMAALEVAGHIAERHIEPTVATFLGDPLELPDGDPFRPDNRPVPEHEPDSKDRS